MENQWTLAIKNQAWTEDTENQVEFLIRTMALCGNEKILDLACGYGRHALSFARRGFSVVGVDYTKAYIDDAVAHTTAEGLSAEFVLADIRGLTYQSEFDVVLNLADGAIGYSAREEENVKVFDVIAAALRPGGKHVMDVCNAEHATLYFPKRHWEAGDQELSLSEFTWNQDTRQMTFAGCQIPYHTYTKKPCLQHNSPTRLYSSEELATLLSQRGMRIRNTYADYYGTPSSAKSLQLIVYSQKCL